MLAGTPGATSRMSVSSTLASRPSSDVSTTVSTALPADDRPRRRRRLLVRLLGGVHLGEQRVAYRRIGDLAGRVPRGLERGRGRLVGLALPPGQVGAGDATTAAAVQRRERLRRLVETLL